MRRFQMMKRSEPDEHINCNTSDLPRNLMDACSAIRQYGYGDMLIMLRDVLTEEYVLIKTPLESIFNSLEYILAQICGCEHTSIHYVEKYTYARMLVLGVTLKKQYFQINNTYEYDDYCLVPYTSKGAST